MPLLMNPIMFLFFFYSIALLSLQLYNLQLYNKLYNFLLASKSLHNKVKSFRVLIMECVCVMS